MLTILSWAELHPSSMAFAAALALASGLVINGPGARRGAALGTRRCAAAFASASWRAAADKEGIQYVGSYTRPGEMPNTGRLPEITLAGRSNVGKSSALNMLSGRRKKVAVVSKTPGRTRTINLFRVGAACTITDLPGYGYAKVSDDMQKAWQKSIEAYLKRREQLRLAVLFVDTQRDPQEADAQLLDFLEEYNVRTLVVGTKADKLNKGQLQASLERLHESLALPDGQPVPLSSTTGAGRSEVWQAIQRLCEEEQGGRTRNS